MSGTSRTDVGAEALVVSLTQVGRGDRWRVGGKAANLGELIGAGLPVPAGFCISTAAFRQMLARAAVAPTLAELATTQLGDGDGLQRIGDRLRGQLLSAPMAADLERAILAHWTETLAAAPCAVRSSATAEDLPDASFAGQQDTVLNVRDSAALLDAVRRCWASLFSQRALAYRQRAGIDHTRVDMGVVVQQLVRAEAAGVLFTINPVNHAGDAILIEGSYGFGEAVVSGRVTPDRFVVERDSLRVVERSVGTKTLEVVSAETGGVREQTVVASIAAAPCLSDVLVQRIAQHGIAAEQVFGEPQDIEWAVAGGEVFVLQSRPISTRPAPASFDDVQVWTNMNVGEVLPDVVSPLTWSFLDQALFSWFREMLKSMGFDVSRSPLIGRVGGRIYFNLNTVVALIRALPGGRNMDLTALMGGQHGRMDIVEQHLPRVTLSRWRLLLPSSRLVAWWLTCTARRAERNLSAFASRLDSTIGRDLTTLGEPALLAELKDCVGQFRNELIPLGGYALMGASHFSNLDRLCQRWLPGEIGVANQLLTGIGGMSSAEAGLDMWRLAALAHQHPEVTHTLLEADAFAAARQRLHGTDGGAAFLARWDAFMRCHGHHARGEIELLNARWSEEPDYVFEQVRSYLRNMGGKNPVETHAAQASERTRRTAALRRRLRNPLKRLAFDVMLAGAQRGLRHRENAKSELVRLLALTRRVALELGQRLAGRGKLERPDGVFFLELHEISGVQADTADDVRPLIRERRAEFEHHQAITPPAVVVGRFDPAACPTQRLQDDVESLSGLGVSPGVVSGPARVILRADTTERILPGEILVAPFTDPGWTPYFQLAAGLVTDLGGLLSHGSIVAREYGLPAVVNVGSATRIIRTGDRLEIDGARGEVRILRSSQRTGDQRRRTTVPMRSPGNEFPG